MIELMFKIWATWALPILPVIWIAAIRHTNDWIDTLCAIFVFGWLGYSVIFALTCIWSL